jgi:hypothetical protein
VCAVAETNREGHFESASALKSDRSLVLLLLVLLGAGTVPNALRGSDASTSPSSGATVRTEPPPSGAPALAGAEPHRATASEAKLRELFEGFTGKPRDADSSVSDLVRSYRASQRGRVFSLIATVPDPESSSFDAYFDQALDAIQRAAGAEGFLPDRFYLPWGTQSEKGSGDHSPEQVPGILLFRRVNCVPVGYGSGPRAVPSNPLCADVLIVLVVGEMPKRGLHDRAFAEAIDLARELAESDASRLFVMGPHFSGTAYSLRWALDEDARRHDDAPPRAVTVISGAATDPGNAASLTLPNAGNPNGAKVTFEAANIPYDEIQRAVFEAIGSRMEGRGTGQPQVAMLIETGTQWATSLDRLYNTAAAQAAPRTFRFPLHISQLRAQWEKSQKDASASGAIPTLRTTLELRLEQERESTDDLPARSTLTPYTIELMLHAQLSEIAREHFSFLGIAATDPTDLIFIVQEARKYCPGVQIFTLASHSIFGHPDLLRDLRGTIVASTYSLAGKMRETFANQGAEGIFNATLALLQRMDALDGSGKIPFRDWKTPLDPGQPGAKVWLSLVSNGAFWPFHVEPPRATGSLVHEAQRAAGAVAPGDGRDALTAGDFSIGLYLLLLALGIAHVAWFARRYAGGRHAPRVAEGSAGLQYVAAMSGTLCFTCAYWASVGREVGTGAHGAAAYVVLALGALVSVLVALTLLAAIRSWLLSGATLQGPAGEPIERRNERWRLLLVGVLFVLGARYAWPFVYELASAGSSVDLRLALARTVQPISGVSPALPLLYPAIGLYLWGALGLRRLHDRARLPGATTPFPSPGEGSGNGARGLGLSDLAARVWAGESERLVRVEELMAIGIAVVPCCFFWRELLPTFESARFDPLFKTLFLFLVLAVLVAAGRLVGQWRDLRRLLQRLAKHPMIEAYFRIGATGSPWLRFDTGPQIPNAVELERSVRIASLVVGGEPPVGPGPSLGERLRAEADRVAEARQKEIAEGSSPGTASETRLLLFRLSGLLFTALEQVWRAGRIVVAGGGGEGDAPAASLSGDDLVIASAEDLVARQVVALLRHALGRLRTLMTFVTVAALLLVFSAGSYPFHPLRFVSLFVWSIALLGVAAISFVIVSAERDAVLSRIARTRPGHLDLNAAFLSKLLIYGVIPIGGLVATTFPEIGDLLSSWLNPLLRVFH